MMHSLLCFTTFNCYLLYSTTKMILHRAKRKVQELVDTGFNKDTHYDNYATMAEITAGRSGVAAETV